MNKMFSKKNKTKYRLTIKLSDISQINKKMLFSEVLSDFDDYQNNNV